MSAGPGVLRRLATSRRDDDRGVVAILVAVLTVVFFGLAALVVDLGFARDQSREAQNAADAAALAGATCMATLTSTCNNVTAATQKARGYVTANGWDAAGTTVDVDVAAQTVTVTLPPRRSPTIFAPAIGQGTPSVTRSATATWNGAGSGCSLCVLNNANLSANADLNMDQGDLLVNGILDLGPNAQVVNTGGRIFANGGVTGSNLSNTLIQDVTGVLLPAGVPTTGPITAPVVDVSRPLGRPDPLGQTVAPSPSGTCSAGTYASVGNCTLFNPGLYVLTGLSSFTGNKTIQATGVTFVLTCSSTAAGTTRSSLCAPNQPPGGSIEVKGGATVNISVSSPPLYATVCFGLAIVSDPNNTGGLLVSGSGNGNTGRLSVDGSIYLKSGTFTYGGGPDLTV